MVLKDLDLRFTAWDAVLRTADLGGAVFLGCHLTASVLARAQAAGAIVFPPIEGLPFRPYRSGLYTPDELYGPPMGSPDGHADDRVDPAGRSYSATLDASIDRWVREAERPIDVMSVLYQRLHDHAITDALAEVVAGRAVVGVMGGHDAGRDTDLYRTVAELSRRLTRAGFLVATGGGPGAMEAANLGAFLSPFEDGLLEEAMMNLVGAPTFDDRDAWLAKAWEFRAQVMGRIHDGPGDSLGVPTWFYGHEPPNVFASRSAKYFENSVREDGLISLAGRGIVFAPGMAGTVQEIFQDVTRNHYALEAPPAPMVFFGSRYWQNELPVVALVAKLAAGRPYADLVLVTDDIDEAAAAFGPP